MLAAGIAIVIWHCCKLLQVVMCDEAHFLKNSDAQITQAVAALPARRRLLMSGEAAARQSSAFCCWLSAKNQLAAEVSNACLLWISGLLACTRTCTRTRNRLMRKWP
jgi:hypothetical protein